MRRQNKKAISDLIATVLIVGITIAAFGIIYSYIVPVIRGGIETSKMCSNMQLSIDTSRGFTNYATNKDVSVMVSRGAKEGDLTAVQIKVNDDAGASATVELAATDLGPNEDKTFEILAADHGLSGTPSTVAVAAVIMLGNKKVYCDLSPDAYLEVKA